MTETTDATVTLTQFTDPMCTWCWGSEPIIRHLETVYGDQLELRFVMGGLIEDFDEFYDAANDISEPSEVAPHWREASEHHGMPVDTTIFDEDPAKSTYPASIAYVAARQQSRDKGHRYLRRLREAFATEVRNVNRRDEQLEIARSVGLDVPAFTTAVEDGSALEEFREDLEETRQSGVRAFPTYHVKGPDGERRVSGFQPFERLDAELRAIAPSLERAELPQIREFIDRYDSVATQEVAEVYDLSYGETRQVLESLVDESDIEGEKRGNGYLWMSSSEGESR
ncbi:DsbA family protein [Halomicroarcula sp. F13]|uniref:DsbA family protein n=1 Tax=Haloarcula rubra TaxID=2487747 RepID=A0AAW4PVS9_9EURY|nr:DsbA family protein [Halomicroarcula rubra]MBX0324372.1 DsbA family protein [Halomicroarcula rubra]